MRRAALFLVVVAVTIVPVQASARPPQGPVTIVTNVDFTTDPVTGAFTVTQGGDLLRGWKGTFEDYPGGVNPPSGGALAKYFTCTDGGNGGLVANVPMGRRARGRQRVRRVPGR